MLGFVLSFRDADSYVAGNHLVKAIKNRWLLAAIISGGLFVLLPSLWHFRLPKATRIEWLERVSSFTSPLISAPLALWLYRCRIQQWDPLLLCFTVLLAASFFALTTKRFLNALFVYFREDFGIWSKPNVASVIEPSNFYRRHLRSIRASFDPGNIVVLLIVIAAATTLSLLTIRNHEQMRTMSYDLGIFNNLMWNLKEGTWFYSSPVMGLSGSHLRFHATFIAYLFLPIYTLFPDAKTLLVIQSVLCVVAIYPLFLIARRRFSSQFPALILAIAYLFYLPQHGALFYDFHFLTLSPFFVLWVAYFFEIGSTKRLTAFVIMALLTREDIPIGLCGLSAYYLFSNRRPIAALSVGLSCFTYFILVKFVIMPLHNPPSDPGQSFTYVYEKLIPAGEQGLGAVVKTVLANPLFTLKQILWEGKLKYACFIFAPVLFWPLKNSRSLWLLLPGFILTFLSTGYEPVIDIAFQYTAHWTPYIFLASLFALSSAYHRRSNMNHESALVQKKEVLSFELAQTTAILFSCVVLSLNLGILSGERPFKGGFSKVQLTFTEKQQKTYESLKTIIALIPKDASVSASEFEVPHISSRKHAFTLRYNYQRADYLLVSKSEVLNRSGVKDQLQAAINEGYGLFHSEGPFTLWKKDYQNELTAKKIKELRLKPKEDKEAKRKAVKRKAKAATPELESQP